MSIIAYRTLRGRLGQLHRITRDLCAGIDPCHAATAWRVLMSCWRVDDGEWARPGQCEGAV